MKIDTYILLLLSSLLLAACTQDNDWTGENPETPRKGTVRLNLQSASISVDTRSTTPQDPQTDNPMYDLCLLHYNFEGQLVEVQTENFRGQGGNPDQPELSYTWDIPLTIDPQGRAETICLIANMEGRYPTWPVRLAELKEKYVDLDYNAANGMIADRRMYMFGYYEGPVTDEADIHILMGRMAAAVKFVITAPDVAPVTLPSLKVIGIEILNRPSQSYFYPNPSADLSFEDFSEPSFTFAANNVITNNTEELIYYYQIGENISPVVDLSASPAVDNRTKVRIKAEYGNLGEKTYIVDLGCDPPTVPEADRNYSLYRNNNYTFHIALK